MSSVAVCPSSLKKAAGTVSAAPQWSSNRVRRHQGAQFRVYSSFSRPSVFSSSVEESSSSEDVTEEAWWESVYVREVMTPDPFSLSPDTSVFKALELLTEHQISGIPVVESTGEVVGVVSAYDILALDCTPGQLDKTDGFFPKLGKCENEFEGDQKAMWRSFLSLRNSIAKTQASKVADTMHDTYCVSENDSLSYAANLIVQKNAQRAFVLNENEQLCGVISRGDILRVTMQKYRELKENDS